MPSPPSWPLRDDTAAQVTAHTLLNCLIREVSGPEADVSLTGAHVVIWLPRRHALLRTGVRRRSLIGAHRFTGPVEELRGGRWSPIAWDQVAARIEAELEARTGVRNPEFRDQVGSSHATIAAMLEARGSTAPHDDPYLASEQSLVYGHRFHPTPKARSGPPETWLRYAPEAGGRFPLRWLAVRREMTQERGASSVFDTLGAQLRTAATPTESYALLPAHPWQYGLLRDNPALQAALVDGRIVDLGEGGPEVAPTASVRTVWHPGARGFLKFSLNVRITNCVRKNSWYELEGAVALSELLRPVATDLAERFPGMVVLPEPAYRTLDGPRDLVEGFGVIARDGFDAYLLPGVTPVLAGAIADEYATGQAHVSALLGPGASSAAALEWWRKYVALLIPPVLYAYFHHGVVFEPHLQNVVVGVAGHGLPRQLFLRDMEGTKVLPFRYAQVLGELAEDVRDQVGYDARRGWNRVVYCLLVNHVAEVLAAVADQFPGLEAQLWREVGSTLDRYAREHGSSPQLRSLRSGLPLPAKTNLLTRWERKADRHATYVPLGNPLAPAIVEQRGAV